MSVASMAQPVNSNHVLFHVNNEIGRAFLWISVGLAILTAFFQGLVTAMALMTEASNRWTFRFRLALLEHWWWSIVSMLLLASLTMNSLSFASSNGGDAISVLALSSATFLAIVQYMLPAWQDRHFTKSRWYAWTGDSRTAIKAAHANLCGDGLVWQKLVEKQKPKLSQLQQTPSDDYGWRLWPIKGIAYNPTDILNTFSVEDEVLIDTEKDAERIGIYHNADPAAATISLKWGREQNFRRVVSRAVSSMPLGLLKSAPVTADGYDGKGLTKAMGILGRNKGLQPFKLVFKMSREISTLTENSSTWTPRPAKVLRSFYEHTLEGQYGSLGKEYVAAAVELALLMADMPYWAINSWLRAGLEHQLVETNQFLATKVLNCVPEVERQAALSAHYESSYVSMIISLNNMRNEMKIWRTSEVALSRPDILCLGLLLRARGFDEPTWWSFEDVASLRQDQISTLNDDTDWKTAAARLLGCDEWPRGFERHPSVWDASKLPVDPKPD